MTPAFQTFFTAARRCAFDMVATGSTLQRELTKLDLPAAERKAADRLCTQLIATKHDVVSEFFELPEKLDQDDKTQIMETIDLILQWLTETVQEFQELTNALQAAALENPKFREAFVIFAESYMEIADDLSIVQEARECVG